MAAVQPEPWLWSTTTTTTIVLINNLTSFAQLLTVFQAVSNAANKLAVFTVAKFTVSLI
jgi:hypothetical protein